ncbi:MAG: Serine/threonine protein kinase PrkC, regulator of stationary phase [Holophagaceae bacterium]|nr:Serine/threonine protein kinase PrkC, regulator of stationary phase [Holophagaceae bacterium]
MPEEPSTIGRYQVQRQIGRGAMGAVYLGHDPLLKRPVAIKVVHPGGEDRGTTLARFQREAEISARLNHPNIVTVFDVGEDPDMGPFIAMEFIEGSSLTTLIRSGLGLEAGIRLMIQGMGAMMAAEAAGIVHRDIKPDNILVSRDGRFKLMDFGIARRDESHLTQAGMIFGTPFYTAPELLVGGEASSVTDRYAYAVTVFEVVTGTLPFQGSTVGSTLYRIVHEPPEMPASLPKAVAEIFLKALAKKPEDRYPDLPSFLGALVDGLELAPEVRARFQALLVGDAPFVSTHPFPVTAPRPSDPITLAEELSFLDMGEVFPQQNAGSPTVLTASGPRPIDPSAPQQPRPDAPPQRRRYVPFLVAAALVVALGGAWVAARHLRFQSSLVSVESTPSGADVSLDGEYVGRTPLRIKIAKPVGRRIHLGLEGYQPEDRVFEGGETRLDVPLKVIPFTISVVTDPPGATVILNQSEVGTTPLAALQIPKVGTQELRIRAKGYQEWSALVDKDAPFPALIRLTPEK